MIRVSDVADEYMRTTHDVTRVILRRLIVKGLSPQQRDVYDYLLGQWPETTSSKQVAAHMDCTLSHASNIVRALHDYGLLTKTVRTSGGWEYVVNVSDIPYNERRKNL